MRKKIRQSYLNSEYYTCSDVIEACGYLNDKRFIQPLIDIANNDKRKDSGWAYMALVHLHVNPYHSEYVKERTRSVEDIKTKRLVFRLEDLAYELHDQASFYELSKYLLSTQTSGYIAIDYDDNTSGTDSIPAYSEAYTLIKFNLQNDYILKLPYIKTKADAEQLYLWMQKNRNKYKIKRAW